MLYFSGIEAAMGDEAHEQSGENGSEDNVIHAHFRAKCGRTPQFTGAPRSEALARHRHEHERSSNLRHVHKRPPQGRVRRHADVDKSPGFTSTDLVQDYMTRS